MQQQLTPTKLDLLMYKRKGNFLGGRVMDKTMAVDKLPNLSNPFSTGGGGVRFEHCVQAMFLLTLMIDGFSPILNQPVSHIIFQGKRMGYHVDDIIIETENRGVSTGKLHCQIKHDITISRNDTVFKEFLQAAWFDFIDESFDRKKDKIALVTGYIAKDSMRELREIHARALLANSPISFFNDINTAVYTPKGLRDRLAEIVGMLNENSKQKISQENIWLFFRAFTLLVVDLDYKNQVNESLIKSLIKTRSKSNPNNVWAKLFEFAAQCNQHGGIITRENFDGEILSDFQLSDGTINNQPLFSPDKLFSDLLILGSWDENNINDVQIVEKITGAPYKQVQKDLQKYIIEKNTHISLREGVWKINDCIRS